MLIGKATFEANTMKELAFKVEKGEYTLPTTLSKEAVSFLNAMLQYDPQCRLTAEELSRHHFLTRDIKEFTRINMNEVRNNLTEDDKLKINVKKINQFGLYLITQMIWTKSWIYRRKK